MFYIILCFFVVTFGIHADEFPQAFQIYQEPSRRTFTIFEGRQFIGAVLNSDYGRFDFFDKNKIKICTNLHDDLFDHSENLIARITWKKDAEEEKWFWERKCLWCRYKTHQLLYTKNAEDPLLTLDEEDENNSFVFRDYQTGKPVAVAFRFWYQLEDVWIGPIKRVQFWHVDIVDRPLLEEKQIPLVFLTWLLLKDGQLYFPEQRIYDYETTLKID